MKIRARLKRCKQNELTFEIPHSVSLELKKDYALDIKPYKETRTLRQNNMLWGLLEQFAEATGYTSWELYMWLLIEAEIKVYTVEGINEKDVVQTYRAFEQLSDTCYRVWSGSSHFDTNEMKRFIDFIMLKASEMDIYLNYEERM